MKKRFLFISCEEAQHICDKSQYDESTIWERIELTIRLSWCKYTKAYYKRNKKLTKALEKAEVECLDQDCKDSMKKEFNKALKEVSN
ncbi:hypothetical protein [Algibacter sp. PT7-4]|uniref:hypothetical protein n=1 Tax=Algibacter ulvanivorans TaxID=3400999 RepID=UPI003AABD686